MTNPELNKYLTLRDTQKTVRAQYERDQAQLVGLSVKARQFLRSSTNEDQAIFELDGAYYRLFIDSDDDIQVESISKIA
jgi:hypothetical protein